MLVMLSLNFVHVFVASAVLAAFYATYSLVSCTAAVSSRRHSFELTALPCTYAVLPCCWR